MYPTCLIADLIADLASGKRVRPVPYGSLEQDMDLFVQEQYRPAGFSFKDPRNMQKAQIINLLKHVYARQERLGAALAFRFSKVVGRHRIPESATYPDSMTPVVEVRMQTQRKHRSRKGKDKDITQVEGSTAPTPANIFAGRLQATSYNADDMVKVDMGQMLKLKDLGCEIVGPINGPNEGPPEYLVPWLWMEKLDSGNMHNLTDQIEQLPHNPLLYPQENQQSPHHAVVDPALWQNAEIVRVLISSNEEAACHDSGPDRLGADVVFSHEIRSHRAGFQTNSHSGPTFEEENTGSSFDMQGLPAGAGAGAGAAADASQTNVDTCKLQPANQKKQRKVVNSDALALQEAAAYLHNGKRLRQRK